MKTSFRYIGACALLAACAAAPASAQNTYSGFFLDNYDYRFEMNPAFGNEKSFVSFPVMGNLNTAVRGTLHLTDILYYRDGKTVLFTNPSVSVKEAMSNFEAKNRIGTDWKIGLMSIGFKGWGGYNTVAINANVGIHASLPKSFFSLAKEGISNKTYSIEDMRANGLAYAEIALGHSRDITQVPGLRVGASLKFLIGMANISADFKNAKLTLGEDNWTAQTNAEIYANIGGFQYQTDTSDPKPGEAPREYVSGADFDGPGSIGPNGFGMAVDLGASYKWNDFTFSLGLLDVGAISFRNTQYATTNGLKTFETDAFTFSANEDADNSFSHAWENMRSDIDKLYQLDNEGNIGNRSVWLPTTLNIGVEYEFPYYRNLHFGLLNSTRIQGPYTWTQFRLSANVAPVKVFSADVNVACGTYGWAFGWMLNIHSTGFNLFVGMDHTLSKLAKPGIFPLNSNADLNFGINFPF